MALRTNAVYPQLLIYDGPVPGDESVGMNDTVNTKIVRLASVSLVMPIHGTCGAEELVFHVPVVGWTREDSNSGSGIVAAAKDEINQVKICQAKETHLPLPSRWISMRKSTLGQSQEGRSWNRLPPGQVLDES